MKIQDFFQAKTIVLLLLFVFGVPSNADDDFSKILQTAKDDGSANVIVKLKTNVQIEGLLSSEADVTAQRNSISRSQSSLLSELDGIGQYSRVKRFETIPYLAIEVDEKVLMALRNSSMVDGIEEDGLSRPTLLQSVPFINGDDVISAGLDGSGWTTAILDTGVRKTHIDLDNGKVVSEACYGTNSSANQSSTLCPNGRESQTGSGAGVNCSPSLDGCSHGTHVAGIAAGTYGGVAPGANIIAIQVFSRFDNAGICGSSDPCVLSYTSDQISGLERVYALRNTLNIASANMSLGGGQFSSACDSDARKAIIDNLRAAGIATVIASGNDFFNGSINRPGCISSAITVGSTLDNANTVSSFSNHDDLVDVLAPGSNITSSVATNNTARAVFNGTSMATPHVAGAYAALRQHKPAATVSEIETALESTGIGVTRASITVPRIDLLAARNSIPPEPDLVIQDMSVDNTDQVPGQAFNVTATVLSQGGLGAVASTLRYYWSTDANISTTDTQLGTDAVSLLSTGDTSLESEQLVAPNFADPYWIGVCVDSVSGETSITNNCSRGTQINAPDSGDILDFIPAMISGSPVKKVPRAPQWGVFNGVCCTTSSTRWRVTQASQSKGSTLASCSASAPSQEGFVQSTTGVKNFTSLLSSSGCGNVPLDFSFRLSNETRYLFALNISGSNLVVDVFSGAVPDSSSEITSNEVSNTGEFSTMNKIDSFEVSLTGSNEPKDDVGKWRSIVD